ncbi:MAG: hypothetical protein VW518_06020 [Burkholderiaceae bacterium]
MGAIRRQRQRLRLAREVGLFFAELGQVPSRRDYSRMTNFPASCTVKEIDRIAGSWNSMLSMIERELPEVWELIHKPKVEEKPKPKVVPKATVSKVMPKAKAATAVKSGEK